MCGFIGCVHENAQEFSSDDKQLFKNMNDIITTVVPMMMGISMMSISSLASAV